MLASLLRKYSTLPLIGMLLVQQAEATVRNEILAERQFGADELPTDPVVRRQVRFWEAIFQKYKSNTVVIHDVDDPLSMIDVIDFDRYVTNAGAITSVQDSDQTELVRKYIERYKVGVERFVKLKDGALKFGPIEQRLYEVYNREPESLARLYSGDIKFRGQGGMADIFVSAAERAQEYMPYIEKTFRRRGLPQTLTRLPFVESMFNLNAKSKVGASGIWQFMPDTGREYMTVSQFIDERNNPYKATRAAAQLFTENYKELKSWPLAVTAYNHGRGGMARASRQLGTSQLGHIIKKYESPTFGFASKNFYSELIAANRTYNRLITKGLVKTSKPSSQHETVNLTRPMSFKEVAQLTKLTETQLLRLNPCITQNTLRTRSAQVFPRNYELRVPKESMKQVRQSLATSGRSSKTSTRR